MTRQEAWDEVERKWHAISESALQCRVSINEVYTKEFEWGWAFVFTPDDPAECPLAYKHAQYAIDRVTGISTPVGNKGVAEAVMYLMKWRKRRAEQATALTQNPPTDAG